MVIVIALYDGFLAFNTCLQAQACGVVVITPFSEKKWILMCRMINISVADYI